MNIEAVVNGLRNTAAVGAEGAESSARAAGLLGGTITKEASQALTAVIDETLDGTKHWLPGLSFEQACAVEGCLRYAVLACDESTPAAVLSAVRKGLIQRINRLG